MSDFLDMETYRELAGGVVDGYEENTMTTTQERLADALRGCGAWLIMRAPAYMATDASKHAALKNEVKEVLAAHDAEQSSLPTYHHGGRPMTLRECMDAEDGGEQASAAEQAACSTCSGSRWLRVLCPDCTAQPAPRVNEADEYTPKPMPIYPTNWPAPRVILPKADWYDHVSSHGETAYEYRLRVIESLKAQGVEVES